MDIDLIAAQPPTHAPIKRRITGDRMNQPITLKGVVTSLSLDPNGERIATITQPYGNIAPPVAGAYKFEPYCNITLRARDLGDPPLGATVEITVNLS